MPVSLPEINNTSEFRHPQPYEMLKGNLLKIVTNAIRSQDGWTRAISERIETVLNCHPACLLVDHNINESEHEILADWWKSFDRLNVSKLRTQIYG